MERTLLLTGFEPFLDVAVNPSGLVAKAMDGERIGTRGPRIRSVELPVSFTRAPGALREAAAALGDGLAGVVSLGVHRGPEFRLEQRARSRFDSALPDNDGAVGGGEALDGPRERRPGVDLVALRALLSAAGADRTSLSNDAGGYLCERVFREGLELGRERGVTALFLHVPPLEYVPAAYQTQVVHDWLASWVR
ncbi:MAG: hypothetical protein VX460_14155 [Planctomycetota bacterium]|nr:hypothetical protein [Planctomycetota bacterium]